MKPHPITPYAAQIERDGQWYPVLAHKHAFESDSVSCVLFAVFAPDSLKNMFHEHNPLYYTITLAIPSPHFRATTDIDPSIARNLTMLMDIGYKAVFRHGVLSDTADQFAVVLTPETLRAVVENFYPKGFHFDTNMDYTNSDSYLRGAVATEPYLTLNGYRLSVSALEHPSYPELKGWLEYRGQVVAVWTGNTSPRVADTPLLNG